MNETILNNDAESDLDRETIAGLKWLGAVLVNLKADALDGTYRVPLLDSALYGISSHSSVPEVAVILHGLSVTILRSSLREILKALTAALKLVAARLGSHAPWLADDIHGFAEADRRFDRLTKWLDEVTNE